MELELVYKKTPKKIVLDSYPKKKVKNGKITKFRSPIIFCGIQMEIYIVYVLQFMSNEKKRGKRMCSQLMLHCRPTYWPTTDTIQLGRRIDRHA